MSPQQRPFHSPPEGPQTSTRGSVLGTRAAVRPRRDAHPGPADRPGRRTAAASAAATAAARAASLLASMKASFFCWARRRVSSDAAEVTVRRRRPRRRRRPPRPGEPVERGHEGLLACLKCAMVNAAGRTLSSATSRGSRLGALVLSALLGHQPRIQAARLFGVMKPSAAYPCPLLLADAGVKFWSEVVPVPPTREPAAPL